MYKEYFNIINSEAPGNPIFISISLLILTVIFIYLKIRKKSKFIIKTLPFITVIGVLFFIISNVNDNQDYNRLQKIVVEKHHSVLEGYIEDFIPEPTTGTIPESFKVGDVNFSYYDNSENDAFHKSSISGGPIKEGLYVRIFYSENKILGLWIKE